MNMKFHMPTNCNMVYKMAASCGLNYFDIKIILSLYDFRKDA